MRFLVVAGLVGVAFGGVVVWVVVGLVWLVVGCGGC